MNSNAMKTLLAGERYLLLQGPMGPFFSDLALWLEKQGREAVNVVFNGGDKFYCRRVKTVAWKKTAAEFPQWLDETWQGYPFDTVICFGDCRTLHRAAREWAQAKSVRFLVFEEGYLRPHYITLEESGVNDWSSLPRDAAFYRNLPDMAPLQAREISASSFLRCWHATVYYLMGCYYHDAFPHYQHHKCFSPWYEARCWWRAGWRKQWYRLLERKVLDKLRNELSQHYYLAILQVYNDSQISHHSDYGDVREYIEEVIASFAKKAPLREHLVIKHHPMDRGHRLYGLLIKRLSSIYGVSDKVMYVHDLPMPQLLNHARGVITINSTAGISALIHNKPLKVMGRALYNIDGLTFQGELGAFWTSDFKPDTALFNKFRAYLKMNTQINMVFYCNKRKFNFFNS
ncbi:capsule biosynthesis protein [Franconibacter helveticus 513]|uniref:capsule biosynthesis protein n=1 Tax=Franconibacter helveticus TaxID=357240 RepID=UPI00042254EE|nr:capsular biosynthesis protein [Franconibacter helveticus]